MPDFALPAVIQKVSSVVAQQEVRVNESRFDGGLRVEWRSQEVKLDDEGKVERVIYSQGVRATYGPTVIQCDRLEVTPNTKQGKADGNVRLSDPEGTLEARNLEFNWEARTGIAEGVSANVDGIRLQVQKVSIEPDKWIMEGFYGTPSKYRRPELALHSSKVVLSPGKSGRIYKPTLELYGLKLGPGPTLPVSLDRRIEGFRLPAVSFKRGAGIGMAWNSGFLITEQSSISGQWSMFPAELPTYSAGYSKSNIPPSKATGFIQPKSDLRERFSESYTESIFVKTPADEDEFFNADRRTLYSGFSFNQASAGRKADSREVSRRFEIATEQSGGTSLGRYFVQVRGHDIRVENNDEFRPRLLAVATLQLNPKNLGSGFQLRPRLDTYSTIGAGSKGQAWARGSLSVIKLLGPFTIGGSLAHGTEVGRAAFDIDELNIKSEAHLRVDYVRGAWKLGYLVKQDLRAGRIYDTEYAVALAAGSFEPFFEVKQFPRTVRFGVRLRAQEVLERLTQRVIKRKIDGESKKNESSKTYVWSSKSD